MKTIPVVGAVIVKQGKILCAQRGPTKTLPGKWEFPGGKIEESETPKDALKREIQEELTCTIEIGKQITRTTHMYEFGTVDLTIYYGRIVSGTPVPTEHSHLEWRWPQELPELDWAPADIPAVDRVLEDLG
ncbi:MAG TPA: (deoxy)nucleoside triphosphate pyrophosphohydrolase [Virgibacillus sp.]|nr:(deoxy)nucleoside triphosphate pyrophosphohydrolase [Virgibacillus sp.]